MDNLSHTEEVKRKRASRRYQIAMISLWTGIFLCVMASGLYVAIPDHFGSYSIVVTVGIGGLFGITSLFMHHESKNKRHFHNKDLED